MIGRQRGNGAGLYLHNPPTIIPTAHSPITPHGAPGRISGANKTLSGGHYTSDRGHGTHLGFRVQAITNYSASVKILDIE